MLSLRVLRAAGRNCAGTTPVGCGSLVGPIAEALCRLLPCPKTTGRNSIFRETLRAAFAGLVACDPDNVAIVPSAGYGVSCAARNLPSRRGDIILGLHDQLPSNYYAWCHTAQAADAEFHIARKEAGQSWADALLASIESIGERIAVATLECHHWSSAEFIDLEVVIPALRTVGARIVLDLTQTLGACPIDIARLAPDFMVAAGYKWQFGPHGVGFLYVDETYFDGVPIEEPWMSREGAEDFFRTTVSRHRRPSSGHHTSRGARLPRTDSRKLATRLVEHGVYASVRGQHLRVTPHL